MKVEMQFFAYFFSASAKKVRAPRLMKVEMQFLASLLLRGALLFSAMAKK